MEDYVAYLHMVEYDENANLKFNRKGQVVNHDELVEDGMTTEVIRVVSSDSSHHIDGEYITPDHDLWCEEFRNAEVGDVFEVSE